MRLSDFVAMLEAYAPLSLAEDYDNVGLLIGTDREIRRVLVALDCTSAVAREAVEKDVDLVLVHHPLLFRPVQRILPDDPDTAAAYRLAAHGIGLYAAHTNLDACESGVNDALAERLGLHSVQPLGSAAIGRVGTLPENMTLRAFIALCNERLHTSARWGGDLEATVRRVGLVGGAGAEYAETAKNLCDVFLTGEMKHHEAVRLRELGMAFVVCGHYETESVIRKYWISRLQKTSFDVQYYETDSEKNPLQSREEE